MVAELHPARKKARAKAWYSSGVQLDVSQLSLVVAAAVFAAFMFWRFRPAVIDETVGDEGGPS